MKKMLSAALAAFMAITLLPGCQKSGTTKDGKTELLLGLPGGDSVTAWQIVDNFKAQYGDKYDIKEDTSSWADFTQKIKLQFVAKTDVTPVFFTDSMQAMTFGAQGAVLDIKDFVDSEFDKEKYNKSLYAISDAEGHLWGVPHGLNSIAVLYNKDILDECGVPYPTEDWTFQDMIDMAKKLTLDRDGDGETDVYGIHYIHNITQGWWPFMLAVGTSPYKNDFRDSNLDDPLVREAMVKYMETVNEGCQMEPAELAAIGGQDAAFADGKVAMVICQASALKAINKFNPELNYDAQIMPVGWSGVRPCVYVPNTWQIYAGVSEGEKEGCLDWLRHYLSEESQMIIASGDLSFPCMKSALDEVTNSGRKPENIDSFYRGIDEHGVTLLENPASSVSRSCVDNMTQKIRAGEDMDHWIQQSHTDMQRELDYFYENR